MENATLPEFKQLVERFGAFELCATKRAAAAFGYLLAKEEAEQSEQLNGKPITVHDDVCHLIEEFASTDAFDGTQATDQIFSLVYRWLTQVPGLDREVLSHAFSTYLPPMDV